MKYSGSLQVQTKENEVFKKWLLSYYSKEK